MRIIYLTGMLPARLRNGTEIATKMVAEALVQLGHEVVLAGYARPGDPTPSGAVIIDRRAIEFSEAPGWQKLVWAGESLARREPLSVTKYRHPQAMAALRRAIASGVDAFIVDKPQIAVLFRDSLLAAPVSVVWHAVEHQTYGAVARGARGTSRRVYAREATLALRMEQAIQARVAHVFVLAKADASAIIELGFRGPINVLPMTVPITQVQDCRSDTASTAGISEGNATAAFAYDVGLLGNWNWSANASGLAWFIDKVLPLLPSGLRIGIGGAGSEAFACTKPGLVGCGFVKDARQFLGTCRAVAIPLTAGTGISMKVLEAACLGWPTVTTRVGARAIDRLPENVAVADTPAAFAECLTAALRCEPSLRSLWARAGATWMKERQAAFAQGLKSGLDHLASRALPNECAA